MVTYLCAVVSIVCCIYIVKMESFWEKRLFLKQPATFLVLYSLFSIPALFSLNGNIHGPYGLLYGFLNFPVIYLFDFDKLELMLFGDRSLENSNMVFGIVSILFWFTMSVITAVAFEISRFMKSRFL